MNRYSISQRLHEDLAKIIYSTPPGDRLLTEPALAKQLGVSRATLREAMRIFESQGLIRRRQGSGTYVTHPSAIIDSGLEVLESIETLAKRIGLSVTMGIHRIDLRSATSEEAQVLGIDQGSQVLQISRIIETEDRPVAYLVDILPENILSTEELKAGFHGSVLDVLLQRGTPILTASRTEITASTATAELARAMGIQRGDVLLHFVAYLYNKDDHVVDYSFSYFLPGYFRFHVVRRVGDISRKQQ
jgi:GntR family transcriptional regulator